MGLNVSHGCWDGSYSSFDAFRQVLAGAAGIPVLRLPGWQEDDTLEPARWEDYRADPLTVLLDHPDDDGDIPVDQELPLAGRLEELAARVPRPYRSAVRAFAAGLRLAHRHNEPVEFF